MNNSYKLQFIDELKNEETLLWSDISYSDEKSVYAFTATRIFIKRYTKKEKYKLKVLNIKEIVNIVLEEHDELGTIKFGGSDPMRENALAWGRNATNISKFESIRNVKEVYQTILKLQYGVYDE